MTRYYYNNEAYGQIYDWSKIFRLYDALKIPDTFWKVPREALNSKYSVILSGRSIAKTTNVLLLGLCQRHFYDTTIVYVRGSQDEFTPTESKNLTAIIASYEGGRYVKQLTGGRFNTIIYKSRAFYYASVDEEGNIVDKDETECIRVLTIDRWYEYKSTLNMPKGDFLVFDEFIRPHFAPDEFIHFCDLIKTVFRDRMSPVIFMLANSLSTTSQYYREMEIRQHLRNMSAGEHKSVTTEAGTKIYIELAKLPTKAQEKRAFFNALFLGFKNEKIGVITGGQLWALPNVPHMYRRQEDDEPTYHMRNLYADCDGDILRLDVVEDHQSGLHLEIVGSTRDRMKEDAIILTTEVPSDAREIYLLGGRKRPIRALILNLLSDAKVFYATNEEGALFKNFIEKCRALEVKII